MIETNGRQKWRWLALSAVPASLLPGVTSYLTSNVAPMPLLWVVPLALYLLTFIIAFSRRNPVRSRHIGRGVPMFVIPLALVLALESTTPLLPLMILHLLVFTALALMCHLQLAETRPSANHLTEFYFILALGGVLGGSLNALLAPVIFKSQFEYPLAIVLACALRPLGEWRKSRWDVLYPAILAGLTVGLVYFARYQGLAGSKPGTMVTVGIPLILSFLAADKVLRFALGLGAVMWIAAFFGTASTGKLIAIDRSFFGVHRVTEEADVITLVHGTTKHGEQFKDARRKPIPLTYYTQKGPMGQVFAEFSGPKLKQRVALVGLGAGSLAAYGEPGQEFSFFEIDPVVVRLASDPQYFTFLRDSGAKIRIVVGDARLTLQDEPASQYGLIVLDAFSSDAIPIHLLTREAVAMYLDKLEQGGVLAFHISNRYVDLGPVLGNVASSLGLVARVQDDFEGDEKEHKEPSRWVIMARDRKDLGGMGRSGFWEDIPADSNQRLWTDDFSNILSALRKAEPYEER